MWLMRAGRAPARPPVASPLFDRCGLLLFSGGNTGRLNTGLLLNALFKAVRDDDRVKK